MGIKSNTSGEKAGLRRLREILYLKLIGLVFYMFITLQMLKIRYREVNQEGSKTNMN